MTAAGGEPHETDPNSDQNPHPKGDSDRGDGEKNPRSSAGSDADSSADSNPGSDAGSSAGSDADSSADSNPGSDAGSSAGSGTGSDDGSTPNPTPNPANPEPRSPDPAAPDPAAFEAMLRQMGMPANAGADAIADATATGPTGQGAGPMGPMGPLGPLLGMLGGGGFQWDAARQAAIWGASNGAVEDQVDPLVRIRFEEATGRVVDALNEMGVIPSAIARPDVSVVTRSAWAALAIEDVRPLLERSAKALGTTPPPSDQSGLAVPADDGDPMGNIFGMLAPMLFSMQAGGAIAELGTQSLATHDLALARASNRVSYIPAAIDAFANEWGVDVDTARMHVVIADVAMHALLNIPHIRAEFRELLERHADASAFDPTAATEALTEQLGDSDMSGAGFPTAMQGLDPSALFTNSRQQLAVQRDIEHLLCPVLGYVDYLVAITGARLLGDNRKVFEAWKRRRAGQTALGASALFGVRIEPQLVERGSAFVGGVMQRAGTDGLLALWKDSSHMPTEAELDAPGLWLARIGLDS